MSKLKKNTVKNYNILNNLKKYRLWKNLTQVELSKIIKISSNQLRLIEANEVYPKYQVRQRLCEYFGISQNQMFYYADGKEYSDRIR